VCANCGRLYTATSHQYIAEEKKIKYKCIDATIGSKQLKGCGHDGIADITKDLGKLPWKVEFAARWHAFDIRFEAYGKDIMDSVKVNDWVAEDILNFPAPTHVKYEMFLDKGGKKISKSLGNVLTSQAWLRYGTPKTILLLLYKRITGAREVGIDDIPSLMEEYNELENIYFGKTKVDNVAKLTRSKGLYEYVNLLNPPKSPAPYVNYRLLIQLCKIFRENRIALVTKKLVEYGTIKESGPEIENLITLAGNYADDYDNPTKVEVQLNNISRQALGQLVKILGSEDEPSDLQNMIYQIAKDSGMQPKDLFKMLYQIILASDRGPKIGPLILDIGRKKVADSITGYL
jgi:lysyl-tRNA synthetase class 1